MPTARLTIILSDIELDVDEDEEDEDAIQAALEQLEKKANELLSYPEKLFELGIANIESVELE